MKAARLSICSARKRLGLGFRLRDVVDRVHVPWTRGGNKEARAKGEGAGSYGREGSTCYRVTSDGSSNQLVTSAGYYM